MRRRSPPSAGKSELRESFAALPLSGEVCGLRLSEELVILEASPGCRHLFDVEAESLVGRSAREVLEPLGSLPSAGAGSLDLWARRGARPSQVRLCWRRHGDEVLATLIDLKRLCRGSFAESAGFSSFGSMLTHEVRNPLSSVKMVVQTLARSELGEDERVRRRLAIAAREIRTIERILTAVAELAHRIPPGDSVAEVPLAVAEAAKLCELDLGERQLRLEVQLSEGLPPVKIDPERLRLSLAHLLAAVAHASPEGTGIVLAVSREGGSVRLEIGSEGPASGGASGTGLSLAMIEKLAREAGGAFSVGSTERLGYVLSLPVAEERRG